MSKTPKLSVIMPVHNGLPYLNEAIRSVQRQRFWDWELVVVDDGSSDGSAAAVLSYDDSRLRLFVRDHQGVSSARNHGLECARGDYVLFLDSDDLLLQDALGDLVRQLDECRNVDAVYSDGYVVDDTNQIRELLSQHRRREPIGSLLSELAVYPNVIGSNACVMARRCVIDSHGIRFDADLIIAEDWRFWIEFARYGMFEHIDSPTCVYRKHRLSTTCRVTASQRRACLARVRQEVRELPEFETMPPTCRYAVLYETALSDMEGDVAAQLQLAGSEHVGSLPRSLRIGLMRLIAAEWLLRDVHPECVRHLLDEAAAVERRDLRLWVLRFLVAVSPWSAGRAVRWSRDARSRWTRVGHWQEHGDDDSIAV